MTASKKELEAIKKLSFEEAVKQLETIVKELEQGSGQLDAAIAHYALGNALAEHCQKKLEEAKLEVKKIMSVANGEAKTAPFDAE